MKSKWPTHAAVVVLTLIATGTAGQVPAVPAATAQPSVGQSQQFVAPGMAPSSPSLPAATAASSAISKSGLLPLFAVDLQIHSGWIDGSAFPSTSPQFPHNGVSDSMQQVWDLLKIGGFNVIRFPANARDTQSATRVANLCVWAKVNGVMLIPVLVSETAVATSDASAEFVRATIARLRSGDGQQWGAYAQIAYYEIGERLNNPALYHGQTPEQFQQQTLRTAEILRDAEVQALQGTNLQPTAIMVGTSFDYELIRQGAISGVPLDASSQQKALAATIDFLSPFASSADIDVLDVEYLPRSISAGDVDSFAPLLRSLKSAAPGKQLVLTTGFSTAFHNGDDQRQFLMLTVGNLADFRASDGASTPFLGAIFREGLAGEVSSRSPEPDVSQWQWPQRAKELQDMWSQGTNSADLNWWLEKTESGLGLVQGPALGSNGPATALAGLQAFQQIANSAAQAAQAASSAQPAPALQPAATAPGSQIPAGVAAVPTSTAFVEPGPVATVPQPAIAPMNAVGTAEQGQPQFQQLLFTLLSQFTSSLTTALVTKFTGSSTNPMAAALPQPNGLAGETPPSGAPTPVSPLPVTQSSVPVSPQPASDTNPAIAQAPLPGAQPSTMPQAPAPAAASDLVFSTPLSGSTYVSNSNQTLPLTSASAGTGPSGSASMTEPAVSAAGTPNANGNNGAVAAMSLAFPQISYFGAINDADGLADNLAPPIVLQLTNSSNGMTVTVQAELRLDGASVANRQIGPMLPKQSRSVLFSRFSAAPGKHRIEVRMSTSQGPVGSETATLVIKSPATPSDNGSSSSSAQPSNPAASASPSPTRFPLPNISPVRGNGSVGSSNSASTALLSATDRSTAPAAVATPAVRTVLPNAAHTSNSGAVSTPIGRRPVTVAPVGATAGPKTRASTVRTMLPTGTAVSTTAQPPPATTPAASGVRTIVPTPSVRTMVSAAARATAAMAVTPPKPGLRTIVPATPAPGSTGATVRTIQPAAAQSTATGPSGRPVPRTISPGAGASATARSPVNPAIPASNTPAPAHSGTASVTQKPAAPANCRPPNNGGSTASSTQSNKNTTPCEPVQK